jgi:HTH-type transcriptional regulator / antitoxin HigA
MDALPVMRAIMIKAEPNFFEQLQLICAEIGIKLCYVPNLPKAPISGCARWYQDVPLIQLSARHKRYDSLWFTFFHELGHILLHGKSEVFLEDGSYSEQNAHKEKQADDFAQNQLINNQLFKTIHTSDISDVAWFQSTAHKAETHRSILHGRLQHDGLIGHHEWNECRLVLELDNHNIKLGGQ